MTEFRRLIELARLIEAPFEPDDLDIDHEDDAAGATWDAQVAREAKIKGLIARAFKKLGLDVETIYYDEAGREATVALDDNDLPLSKLEGLRKTGLAADFTVSAGKNFELNISFIVNPNLDHAVAGP